MARKDVKTEAMEELASRAINIKQRFNTDIHSCVLLLFQEDGCWYLGYEVERSWRLRPGRTEY